MAKTLSAEEVHEAAMNWATDGNLKTEMGNVRIPMKTVRLVKEQHEETPFKNTKEIRQAIKDTNPSVLEELRQKEKEKLFAEMEAKKARRKTSVGIDANGNLR